MNALVPNEMVEQAAHIIDQHAFTVINEMSDPKRQKRQAIARRKAEYILRLWTRATVDPGFRHSHVGPAGNGGSRNRPHFPAGEVFGFSNK